MLKIILLVCAAAVPRGECNERTALHVLNGPECSNEISCTMQSQAYLANTAIGRSMDQGEYLKIKVMREKAPQRASLPGPTDTL